MIARPLRLRRPFEFERVRKRGRSWATHLVVLAVLPNDLKHNRYGFAVGRRVGGAVDRNRIKRWLRESVRELHPTLQPGHDMVFIARGSLAREGVDFEQVRKAVRTLTRNAGLMDASDRSQQVPPDSSGSRSE
jgi:ribonuclease P protein component